MMVIIIGNGIGIPSSKSCMRFFAVDLVSLFNGISTFRNYLMPKLVKEQQWYSLTQGH